MSGLNWDSTGLEGVEEEELVEEAEGRQGGSVSTVEPRPPPYGDVTGRATICVTPVASTTR